MKIHLIFILFFIFFQIISCAGKKVKIDVDETWDEGVVPIMGGDGESIVDDWTDEDEKRSNTKNKNYPKCVQKILMEYLKEPTPPVPFCGRTDIDHANKMLNKHKETVKNVFDSYNNYYKDNYWTADYRGQIGACSTFLGLIGLAGAVCSSKLIPICMYAELSKKRFGTVSIQGCVGKCMRKMENGTDPGKSFTTVKLYFADVRRRKYDDKATSTFEPIFIHGEADYAKLDNYGNFFATYIHHNMVSPSVNGKVPIATLKQAFIWFSTIEGHQIDSFLIVEHNCSATSGQKLLQLIHLGVINFEHGNAIELKNLPIKLETKVDNTYVFNGNDWGGLGNVATKGDKGKSVGDVQKQSENIYTSSGDNTWRISKESEPDAFIEYSFEATMEKYPDNYND